MRHQRAAQDKTSDQSLHKVTKTSNKPMLSNRNAINPVLQLQQTIGNRAVNRMIQPKLKIGQPGDVYEQEADRVAEMVMRMPDPHAPLEKKLSGQSGGIQIQRKCKACEKEEEVQMFQAKEESGQTPEIKPSHEGYLNSIRSGGQPLPASVRAFFEPRFGYDFSHVRIHTDSRAANVTRELNARAFTIGRDIVFGDSEYSPGTDEGRRLMTHELVHIIQQGNDVIRRQYITDESAGGCGICQGPRNAGNDAHQLIQEEFETLNLFASVEFPIPRGRPDLVLPLPNGLAIGEIKPANPQGYMDGAKQMSNYLNVLQSTFPNRHFEPLNLPIGPWISIMPNGRPDCPLQNLFVNPPVEGVYGYFCSPPYSKIRRLCRCKGGS